MAVFYLKTLRSNMAKYGSENIAKYGGEKSFKMQFFLAYSRIIERDDYEEIYPKNCR